MTSVPDKDAPNLHTDSHSALPLPPSDASHRSAESQPDAGAAPESENNSDSRQLQNTGINTATSQQPHDSAVSFPPPEQKSKQAQVLNRDSSETMSSFSDPPYPRNSKNDDDDTDSSMLGQKLKRRLMDIESSFIPDGAAALPTVNSGNSNQSASKLMGADDTF